jgi:amino acid transporter
MEAQVQNRDAANTVAVAQTELQGGAISLPGALMQGLTHIAPAVGLIFTVPVIAGLAGLASPLAFLAGGVLMILVAVSVVELAKRLSSAGGYFTWVSRTLGPRAGFLTAWMFFLYSPIGAGINFAFLGGILEPTLKAEYGFTLSWWIPALLGTALVAACQYYGVKISVRTIVIFGGLEVLLCLALAVSGLINPGPGGFNFSPFDPSQALSLNGFYLAVVFSVFTFSGFESVAPLAEESKDPRKTLPLAVILSLVIACIFFLLMPWGILVGWGTSDFNGFASNESPVFALAHNLWGGAWVIILIAFVNSILAVSLAASNAGTRVFYGMGRVGALPSALGKVDPVHKTPTNAVFLQTAITLAIVIGGGIILGPVDTLVYGALLLTLAAIFVYCAGNIAAWRLYRTEQRQNFRLLWHFICPVLATAALLWVGYKTVNPAPTGVAHSAPYVFLGWLVAGIGVTFLAARFGASAWLRRAGEAVAVEEVILDETLGVDGSVPVKSAEPV